MTRERSELSVEHQDALGVTRIDGKRCGFVLERGDAGQWTLRIATADKRTACTFRFYTHGSQVVVLLEAFQQPKGGSIG